MNTIESYVSGLDGVDSIKVDLTTKLAVVFGRLPASQVMSAIEEVGASKFGVLIAFLTIRRLCCLAVGLLGGRRSFSPSQCQHAFAKPVFNSCVEPRTVCCDRDDLLQLREYN